MHFLLSNDDGVQAPGLREIALQLAAIGDVTVVAPDRERSATGHAITVYYPLRVQTVPFPQNITAYAVDGTPADCVRLGLEVLMPPDNPCTVVVSGINRGVNLGTDVIYSGTVSAAIEAAVMSVPAVAISLADQKGEPNWSAAATVGAHIVTETARRGLPADTILNVNVPPLPLAKIKGVQVTRLGIRRYKNGVHKREDPRGGTYYWRAGIAVDEEGQEGTDAQALAHGYVSVTPVHFDLTHYAGMAALQQWPLFPK